MKKKSIYHQLKLIIIIVVKTNQKTKKNTNKNKQTNKQTKQKK